MSTQFAPDSRNMGGRTMLIKEHLRHKNNLKKVKSQIDMGDSPKKSVRPKSARARPSGKDEFAEIRETFRRVTIAKPSIDNKRPQTASMAKVLSSRRKSTESPEMKAHRERLAHMGRRIRQFDSVTERKKNPYDPKIYPSLVRRTGVDVSQGTAKDAMTSVVNRKPGSRPTSARSARPSSARSSRSKEPGTRSRPQSARSLKSKKSDRGLDDGPREISGDHPVVRRIEPTADPYREFKHALVDTIVSNRIYQQADLENLFRQSVDLNPHLNRRRMEDVIDELKSELEM